MPAFEEGEKANRTKDLLLELRGGDLMHPNGLTRREGGREDVERGTGATIKITISFRGRTSLHQLERVSHAERTKPFLG